jgi:ribosomal protein S18 acetylase RimI-like enzyme
MIAFIIAGKNHNGDPQYVGEIYNLHVMPAFQSQGIGRYLLYRVSQIFRLRGWHTMMVWSLAENPNRLFYETMCGRIIAQANDEYRGFNAPVIAYGWDELPTPSFNNKGDRGRGY